MESPDDDICILSHQDTVDGYPGHSGLHLLAQDLVTSTYQPDPALHALQEAYTDLRIRYNESMHKNQNMSRALQDLGKACRSESETSSSLTDSTNVQGAAAMGVNSDVRYENTSLTFHLQHEKESLETRLQQMTSLNMSYEENIQAMQLKLSDTVNDLKQKELKLLQSDERVSNLMDNNIQLRNELDTLKERTCEVNDQIHNSFQNSLEKQSIEMNELRSKYNNLAATHKVVEAECDRLKVSEHLAKMELQVSNSSLEALQESHAGLCRELDVRPKTKDMDLISCTSGTTATELSHLKKVISDLRNSALQQKEFLHTLGRVVPTDDPSSWERISLMPGIPSVDHISKDVVSKTPQLRSAVQLVNHSSDVSSNPPHSPRKIYPPARSEVLLRKSAPAVSGLRCKSEVISRAPPKQRNLSTSSPCNSRWQQHTVNNFALMNGGTLRSTYDNTDITDITELVVDKTPAFPVHLNVRQPMEGTSPPEVVQSAKKSDDLVCPVCSRDFNSMLMDDFQSHVFECFDDHSAPETIKPSMTAEKICPMCNKLFLETLPQEEFEKHVQTHFVNDSERFEILNP